MNKFTKKISIGLLSLSLCGSILPVINTVKVSAQENQINKFDVKMNELKTLVDNNLDFNNEYKLYLKNEDKILNFISSNFVHFKNNFNSPEDVLNDVKTKINELNKLTDQRGNYFGRDKSVKTGTDRAAGVVTSTFWWGKRDTYLSDSYAYQGARQVELAGQTFAATGAVVGAALSGGALGLLAGGGMAMYFNSIASSMRYNASLAGNGIVLDVNYWLTYSCYPRK